LRTCEITRTENDILDAANSLPAHQLGDGAIRFSSMPELGGDAYVVEFRPDARGGARVRFNWFYGHLRWRWISEGSWTFDIAPRHFREFSATVDDAMSRVQRDPGPGEEESFPLCTDGPGFLTERVLGAEVVTMNGFCPYSLNPDVEHPNRAVEIAVLNIICPRFRPEFNPRDGLGQKCLRRARRMRSAHR
jgi:hypothetical protein